MVGWHHQLNGHEFEQTLRDSVKQENLACYSSWACRVGHNLVTEQQQQNTYVNTKDFKRNLKRIY